MNAYPGIRTVGCRAETANCDAMRQFTINTMQYLQSCRESGTEPPEGAYSDEVYASWDYLITVISEGFMSDEGMQAAEEQFRRALLPDFVNSGFCPLTRDYPCESVDG